MANRALLVGIDSYPDPVNRLNSCINDTLAFKDLLSGLGFRDSSIRVLHDADATLAGVRDGLDWLFAQAQPDDRLVFFQSSHGYRYLKGDVMTEVLCEYDDFLEDTELVSRSSGLPPDVLTVVLDACHSGGMDKSIFVRNTPHAVRAKVFIPPAEKQLLAANSLTAVRGLKPFGRTALLDEASLARNMANVPNKAPLAKAPITGNLELDGILFAACQADQTAAAGSDETHRFSAFTYAVTTEMDSTISVASLCDRVVQCLASLNMNQTPAVFAPATHQEVLAETFISMSQATTKEWMQKFEALLGSTGPSGPAAPEKDHTAPTGRIRTSNGEKEEKEMSTSTMDQAIETILEGIRDASPGAAKDWDVEEWGQVLDGWRPDFALCAAAVAPAVAAAVPTMAKGKGLAAQKSVSNPDNLGRKDLWDVALQTARIVVPAVLDALGNEPDAGSKGLHADTQEMERRIAASAPARRLGDKDFFRFVNSVISDLAPMVIDAVTKDYSPGSRPATGTVGSALPLGLSEAERKSFWDDALDIAGHVLPYVVQVAAAVA
ncbi:caspase family protein [Streptomyces sp. 900105755]